MTKEQLIIKAAQLYPNDKILRDAFAEGAECVLQELGMKLTQTSSLKDSERDVIISMLMICGDNRKVAARRLGIGERTLYRKIKQYNLNK